VNHAPKHRARSRSSLGMGCDWYATRSLCTSSDYAIMVTNKDIKETRRPGSTKKDIKVERQCPHGQEDEEEDLLDDPLDQEDIEWLLRHAPAFRVIEVEESFVLFTKSHHDIVHVPFVGSGPYELEKMNRFVCFNIDEAPKGELYTELLELARKFTPAGSKLSFAPGKYTIAKTRFFTEGKWGSVVSAADSIDFELIVGNGDEKKTIGINKALFFCCFPHFETRFSDALMDTKLELPELDPQAVQRVLDAFTSRKKVEMLYWDKAHTAFYHVQCVFGKSMIEMANQLPSSTDRPRLEHPAIADPRWLDAIFLCGPQKEEIKANRSVLASMNPVLHRILFGTDLIPVDPSKPIDWPDYDAQAVRQVFLALLHCGKKDFVVPIESVESAKMLVDYLGETREDLMLIYGTSIGLSEKLWYTSLDLIVGSGDKKKTIRVGKYVFLGSFPYIKTTFQDAWLESKLEVPELEPWAVQRVLDAFTSRKRVEMPYCDIAVQNVQRMFGRSMIEMANKATLSESSRLLHPVTAGWPSQASFLCGPQREEVKVSRAFLASTNPVLHGILFDDGWKCPIEWPDYDAQAVRKVFLALLHFGKTEFVVPLESVESAKMLLDYLGETREALMLHYETPFKREYYEATYTVCRGNGTLKPRSNESTTKHKHRMPRKPGRKAEVHSLKRRD